MGTPVRASWSVRSRKEKKTHGVTRDRNTLTSATGSLTARRTRLATGLLMALMLVPPAQAFDAHREQLLPILGVTMEQTPIGTVANLILSFDERSDHEGLAIQFKTFPGRFSRMAQTAVEQAIIRAAKSAGLSPDSWTVILAVPYAGVTIYGDSLSAMVAVGVVALAKGEFIPPDRVMTGAVTPDGHISPVGAVPLKVLAAGHAHMRRILVPDENDPADSDWTTPFLVQVSPVASISQAYEALTDHPLLPELPSAYVRALSQTR